MSFIPRSLGWIAVLALALALFSTARVILLERSLSKTMTDLQESLALLRLNERFAGDPEIGNARVGAEQTTERPLEPSVSPEPIEFSEGELQKYYKVYQNAYVLHLRKALNGYLSGSNEGMDAPSTTIEAEQVGNVTSGLASFDKEYYKSKFIVFAIDDFIGGGKEVTGTFLDKPDKMFSAWVYSPKDSDHYDLRKFWQKAEYTEDVMKIVQIMYEAFLKDREHSL